MKNGNGTSTTLTERFLPPVGEEVVQLKIKIFDPRLVRLGQMIQAPIQMEHLDLNNILLHR